MRSSLFIIFLVVFIDLMGFGIVIPILPYYAESFGSNAWQLGWLMAAYSLMQFLVSPLWGRLSDRIGRRPVLLMSILGTGASMAILGVARSLVWLFAGRIMAGICAANISTAYAYITDITTEENRAKGMGIVGAGFGLGFIFGPAIGGILSHYGYGVPMFAGAILALLNFCFASVKLKEPGLSAEARAGNRARRFDLQLIRNVLSDPRTRLGIGLFFLVTLAVTQMETSFAIYMGALFGFNAQKAGMILALMGLIMVLVQGGLIGRLVRRFGEIQLITVGLVGCALGLTGFGFSPTVGWVVISLSLMAFFHGTLHPSLSSLASKGASPQLRGSTMGVFQSAGSLARVVGPPFAGLVYDEISPRSPFFLGSLLLLLGFGIILSRRQLNAKPANLISNA